jgi:hypothetical protein
MASNDLFLPKRKETNQTWGTQMLSGYESNPKKKDTRWSFKSLYNAVKEAGIGIALSTPQMQILGLEQTKQQVEKGIKPTVDNNLLLRRTKRWNELLEKNQPAREEDYIDVIEDYEKGIYKGIQNLDWAIGDLLTAGIDLGKELQGKRSDLNYELTKKMEENRIADPETLVGDGLEILTEYGVPSSAVIKIGYRLKKLFGIRKLTGLSKYPKGSFQKGWRKATNVANKVGSSAAAFGAIDYIASSPDRPTFAKMEDLKGLRGKERALASLRNRLRFGKEGAIFGMGFTLMGKPAAFGLKYGLTKLGQGAGIGLKVADAIVVNPLSAAAAGNVQTRSQVFNLVVNKAGKVILPPIARKAHQVGKYTGQQILPKAYLALTSPIKSTFGFKDTKTQATRHILTDHLPRFKDWIKYSRDSTDPLKARLKTLDNMLGSFRSVGRMTPEQYELTVQAGLDIKGKMKLVTKAVESLENRATGLAKKFKDQYKTNTTSPANQQWHLNKVLEYLKNQRTLGSLSPELREMSKLLKVELEKLNKAYGAILPKGDLRDAVLGSVGNYMRASFATFTNPYYKPDAKVFNAAVEFVSDLISKDKSWRNEVLKFRPNEPVRSALTEEAHTIVNGILRTGRADNHDPLQALRHIQKHHLKGAKDLAITTGEELPVAIKNLLGHEKNLKSQVLTTATEAIVQTVNKAKGDNLARLGLKQGWLWPSKEAAERAGHYNVQKILPEKSFYSSGIRTALAPKRGGELWAEAHYAQALNGVNGLIDNMIQGGIMKNILAFKVAAQYGKTVLSPATQVRNVTSAAMFALASGHIGGKASVTNALKMTLDDIFGAGKVINEEEFIKIIEDKVKRGVLDENIIASELKGVMNDIKASAFKQGSVNSFQRLIDKIASKKLLRAPAQTATKIYAGGDNVWKFFGDEFVQAQYRTLFNSMDDVAKWWKEIPGIDMMVKEKGIWKNALTGETIKTLDEAIKLASAWSIRNTYPTYSKVPSFIKGLRKIPFFGNFVSFPAEMTRTSFNLINLGMKEVGSSNAALRQIGYRRLLGTYTVMGGASSAALKIAKTLTGVTDEELDAYKRSFAADWNKYSVIIPLDRWVKGKGKALNFSYFSPYDVVQQPIEAFLKEYHQGTLKNESFAEKSFESFAQAMYNYSLPFLSRSIAYEKWQDVVGVNIGGTGGVTKTGVKVYSESDDWSVKALKSAYHFLKGTEPGAITTGRKIKMGFEGDVTKSGQPVDLSDELLALFTGIRVIPVDVPKSMQYKIAHFQKLKRAVDDAEKFYSPSGAITGRVGDNMVDEYKNIQDEAFKVQQDFYYVIQDAMKTGLSERDVKKILRTRLSYNETRLLMKGRFVPWKVNKTRMKKRILALQAAEDEKGTGNKVNKDAVWPKKDFRRIDKLYKNKDLKYPVIEEQPETINVEPNIISDQIASLPKVFEKFLTAKKPVVEYNVPVETTPVSQEVVQTAASNVNINPETGLTRIDDALLSREEKAMRLRQKGMTA